MGTGPLNAGPGPAYGTVYLSGVPHNILYGAVNVTSPLYATCHNVDPIGEKHCDTVCATGAKAEGTSSEEVCNVVAEVAPVSNCDAGTLLYPCDAGACKEDTLVSV